MLQFFFANTSVVNSKRAINECLENTLPGEPNLDCDLIIFYSAMRHHFKVHFSEGRKLSTYVRILDWWSIKVINEAGKGSEFVSYVAGKAR